MKKYEKLLFESVNINVRKIKVIDKKGSKKETIEYGRT